MNFLAFVPRNFESPWVPFCSKFKLRFHLDAFGDHERSASGCGHAKRCCVKTDTTRFPTAPWHRPCCIKGPCECCAHAQRSEGTRLALFPGSKQN